MFFIIKVYCVFSLESPHRVDSDEYTKYTIFDIKRKTPLIIPNLQMWDFFRGTEQLVRNSRAKRSISVRAIEVLFYNAFLFWYYAGLRPVAVTYQRQPFSFCTGGYVPGRVAQSVGHPTHRSEVLGSIPGLATYFRFSFR